MTSINTATVTQEDIKKAETSDIVSLYNEITGESIKKFRDRATAERRVWAAIGRLAPNEDIREESKVVAVSKKEVKKRESYENRVIQVMAKENPKRSGSRAHKKFEVLMNHDGKTIQEFKKAEGRYSTLDMEKGWPATELRWAWKLGLVKIVNA